MISITNILISILISYHKFYHVDNTDYLFCSYNKLYSFSFLYCLFNVSGTNFKGNINNNNPKDSMNILFVYVLTAMVTSNGDRKQPNCPNPYMEPAPTD